MKTLSLKVKLTLVFAIVMAALLATTAVFIYLRVGGALLSSVDHNLRLQAAETSSHLRRERSLVDPDTAGGPMLAQLLDRNGSVVRSTPAGIPPLIDPQAAAKVAAGRNVLRTNAVAGRTHEWRLLAVPVGGHGLVLALDASLAARQDALDRLLVELAIAGPIALLLSSLAGYALAAGALRPVESMRRRAAVISASTPGQRLPTSRGHDEIARLAVTLNEMLARLEKAFEHERAAIEHERRFIADASHELRTPLALLQTELEVALRRPRSRQELEAALRSAAEETERLTRLAADLLLIARFDQGRLPLRREPVSALDLLDSAAERFIARAGESRQAIVVVDTDCEHLVNADPAYVEQALGGLIENALRYGAGPIELSAAEREGLIELHVVDHGPGLPTSFLPLAFDRFSRADEARGRGGTGLGLSIVDLIARAHGGSAGVANSPDGGADVWIALEGARNRDRINPVATEAYGPRL